MGPDLVQDVYRKHPCVGENCADLLVPAAGHGALIHSSVDRARHSFSTCVCARIYLYPSNYYMCFYIHANVCESIIVCLALSFLPPPSFPPLLFFCSTSCLSFMPAVFLIGVFPFFFLTSFPLSFLFWLFILYLFIHMFQLKVVLCLLLSLAKTGWLSTLLASPQPESSWPRSGHSCARYFLKKKRNKGVGAALVSLLSK